MSGEGLCWGGVGQGNPPDPCFGRPGMPPPWTPLAPAKPQGGVGAPREARSPLEAGPRDWAYFLVSATTAPLPWPSGFVARGQLRPTRPQQGPRRGYAAGDG